MKEAISAGAGVLLLGVLLSPCLAQGPAAGAEGGYRDPLRFEEDIQRFEVGDAMHPPLPGAIVCVGSSSMRRWHETIAEDLAPLTVIRRGFGGSTMGDVLHYADRILLPYRPRAIVLYAGENDIANGISPGTVAQTFHTLVETIHAAIPSCRVYFLSIKPSIRRWGLWPRMEEANHLIAATCAGDPRLTFVDVASAMLDENHMPRKSIYQSDDLHITGEGYLIWRDVLRPILLAAELPFQTVPVSALLGGREDMAYQVSGLPEGWTISRGEGGTADVAAPAAVRAGVLRLTPTEGDAWDVSAFGYVRVEVRNTGDGILWLEGRLDNDGARDWANSTASQVFLRAGEAGTLGFPFPRAGELDDSPAIFDGMAAKLNGWRSHWKKFDPARVRQLRLVVHSVEAPRFIVDGFRVAWPYGSANQQALEQLPFLDEFGQVHRLNWPGKTSEVAELVSRARREGERLAEGPLPAGWDRFGGWAAGPQLEATGYFRLARHADAWWFVDPDGHLFWSHGVDSVGFGGTTPATPLRRDLFAWLPEAGHALDPVMLSTNRNGETTVSFSQGNLARALGDGWVKAARDRIHRRFADWGLNTLGAWCDGGLVEAGRTPYTLVVHVGWPHLPGDLPNPFDPSASGAVRGSLDWAGAPRREDPWCLGVFIDNEVHWGNDIPEKVFARPAEDAAKRALVGRLRERHADIAALNQAWQTTHADWDALLQSTACERTDHNGGDLDDLVEFYAAAYYRLCRDAMRETMPNHLYLGSRIHTCPAAVARAAVRFVDVFSVNHYANLAGPAWLPANADLPVLVTEFHFGALDRGVPGAGLVSVHDQVQRGRAYQNYVVAGLLHPQVVGTHWFAWGDQSAAGRPGENYQVGFVDVTDSPYPEFTTACRALGRRLYEIRSQPQADRLRVLESLAPPAVSGAAGDQTP